MLESSVSVQKRKLNSLNFILHLMKGFLKQQLPSLTKYLVVTPTVLTKSPHSESVILE